MGIRRNILVLPVTSAQGWNLARLRNWIQFRVQRQILDEDF